MMRRVGSVVAAVALSMTGLAACSGGDDAYCGKLEEASADLDVQANIQDLGAMKDQLEKAKGHVEDISGAAPEDVAEHWTAMKEGIDGLSPALDEFEGAGDLKSLSMEEKAKLLQNIDMQAFEESAKKLSDAGQAIDKDANERCGMESQ